MADSIYKWSLTAANNDAADSIINWRENQLPDTVNDSARAMMQRIAEWREDMTGNLVTTGTAPAYVLATNAAFDTLTNGRVVKARIHATNPAGAPTLNVNGLGAKSVRKFGASGDIAIGVADLQAGGVYGFTYSTAANAGAGGWIVDSPASSAGFAPGTALLFAQATAPVGWTKSVANDDKALRVVSGSTGGSAGGSTAAAFSAAFKSRTVSDVALTAAQMPSHTHTQQGSFTSGTVSVDHTHGQTGTWGSGGESVDHSHTVGASYIGSGTGSNGGYITASSNGGATSSGRNQAHSHNTSIGGSTGGISANHTHAVTISGATTGAGSDQTHNHTLDMSVQYVDTIICTKD